MEDLLFCFVLQKVQWSAVARQITVWMQQDAARPNHPLQQRSRSRMTRHPAVPAGGRTRGNFSAMAGVISEGDRNHHSGTYRQRKTTLKNNHAPAVICKAPAAPCNHDLDRASQQ
uniref:Uncharacterized protein n=1 Tax=Anopheles melas TaxID=34690 RepID=A0A182TT86_9DIPT